MRRQAAPLGDSGLDRQPLLDLAEPDEVIELFGPAEGAGHGFGNPRIAARVLLVAFVDGGGNVTVLGRREPRDHILGRIGLEPKFRTKARGDIAVMVEIAALVPDGPEVHVALAVVMPRIPEIERTCRWR